jgi:RNA recognition motif-containing protein
MSTEQQQQTQPLRDEAKLFVGQVPAVCTEEMLRPLFQPYGTIVEIKVMRDGPQGRSKGCAWVRYEKRSEAEQAIEALHDKRTIPPQTNALQVRFATPKAQAAPRGGAAVGGTGAAVNAAAMSYQQQLAAAQAFYNPFMMGMGAFAPYAAVAAAGGRLGAYSAMPGLGAMAGYPAMGAFVPQPQLQQAQVQAHGGAGRGGADYSTPSRTLFLGNLSMGTTEDELLTFVEQKTGMKPVEVRPPRGDKRFGFVSFESAEEGTAAKAALEGSEFRSLKIQVQFAQDRQSHQQQPHTTHQQHGGGFGDEQQAPRWTGPRAAAQPFVPRTF